MGCLKLKHIDKGHLKKIIFSPKDAVNKKGNAIFFRLNTSPYGFNGMEGDDEVSGQGNSYDFGARIYNPRIGRWASTDAYERKYPEITPYGFVQNSPISMMDPDGNEGIVVSGQPGEHNNKEHFLINGLDRAKAAQGRVKNNSEKVTWLIYDSGDSETGQDPKLLASYIEKAAAIGVTVIVVSNEDEIINYVNTKSTDGKDGGRSKDLISSFYYIGHATPGDMEVGYAEPGIDDYVAASDFLPEAFASGCWVNVVGGCRTAVDGYWGAEDSVVDEFSEILDEESTINGSNVRVQYEGGVMSDEELLKENDGEIVTKKGELPKK